LSILRNLLTLIRDRRASVATLAALALPVMIGALGLVVDLNRGYEQRVFNQRAADMAALGAAMAYKATSDASVLTPTARNITLANGLPDATVEASIVENFPEAGSNSVRVVVTEPVPYTLGRVLGFSGSFNVKAQAYATLTGTETTYSAPCFLALADTSAAISVSGGASIDAASCAVAAIGSIVNNGTLIRAADIISGNGSISVDWGSLVANTLRYAGSFTFPSWNANVPPVKDRVNEATSLADPWATDAELITARSLLGSYTAVPTLANPTTPTGSDWTMGWSPTANVQSYRTGPYTGEYVVPAGNYTIKKLTIDGGIKVTFQSGSNITVSGGVSIGGGSTVDFGNANLYVNGGFDSGSNGVTIGNGQLWIGSGTVKFQGTNRKGDGDVIINANVSLGGGQKLYMGVGNHHFGGLSLSGGGSVALDAGNFTAVAGIVIGGDSELAISAGDVIIGPNSSGYAINLSGSARLFMEDGAFSANGNITTAGGSRIVFGKTANHYINGNMTIAGSALFGAGRYTINGNFTNGTGGTTWPYTSSLTGKTYGQTLEGVSVSGYDMAGVDVTFILKGTLNLGGGAKTKLIAATSSVSGAQIADLLIDSLTTSDTTWGAGSQNVFVGTVHLPNSTVTMSGGNTTLSAGQCFSLIAYKINVSGGAATGSACAKMSDSYSSSSGGGSGEIRLVK